MNHGGKYLILQKVKPTTISCDKGRYTLSTRDKRNNKSPPKKGFKPIKTVNARDWS